MLCLQNTHASEANAEVLVDAATRTVDTFAVDPDMAWLRDNMDRAKGVLIVPSLLKGGLILGGSAGHGVLLVRGKDNTWSHPAFYTMGSGTIGLQAGVEMAELIMILMTGKSVDGLLTSSFKLGGDISIAAGP